VIESVQNLGRSHCDGLRLPPGLSSVFAGGRTCTQITTNTIR
jgi:hypothetical protein